MDIWLVLAALLVICVIALLVGFVVGVAMAGR